MPVSAIEASPSSARSCGDADRTNGHSISLTELLAEAELGQYEEVLRLRLKIMRVEHLKDVRDTDLSEIGMSKPEQRRLMKAFNKYFPSSLAKLKQKVLHRRAAPVSVENGGAFNGASNSRTWSPFPLRRCSSNEEAASASAVDNDILEKIYAADDSQASDGEQHIIPASNIILCRQLGKGEFGTVWQGVWTTTSHSSHRYNPRGGGTLAKIQVAVKQIMSAKMLASPLDFVREAAIMHRIHHENIVRFFGVVLDTQTIMLVTELAPSRSLAECLKEDRSAERFSVVQLCEFALQICCGMTYLEANRFIHRDLAARNILVFSTHKVKISDFGLSRALGTGEEYYRGNFTANLKLPIAWCAPECINYLKFTTASDVWAYGITLWEMFTYGFQPWAGMNGQQIFDAVNAPKMCRLERPDACPQDYYNLMQKCWQHEPEQRPKFSEILSILPTVEPERVVAVKPCQDGQLDHLQYATDAVITVLNKQPIEYPDGFYWKGVLKNGRTGLFLPTNTVAYLESQRPGMPTTSSVSAAYYKTKPVHHHHHNGHKLGGGFLRSAIDSIGGLARRSAGKAGMTACAKEKNGGTRPFISLPQNDLRHTGHLGLDGICFGDVPPNFTTLATLKNIPKHPTIHSFQTSSTNSTPKRHHFESYSLDTACLLSDDEGGDENGHSFLPSTGSGDNGSCADLDDVPIVCGDSGGWLLEEVLQALDQRPSNSGGCTNVAAAFNAEDGHKSGRANGAPLSPTSMPEDEQEEEETSNDTTSLWSAPAPRKKQVDEYGKGSKENVVKPLSSSDSRMLHHIDKLADKMSSKALDKERERLQEERRKLGLPDDVSDKCEVNRKSSGEGSPSPTGSMKRHLIRKLRNSSPTSSCPSSSNHRPTFTDTLAMKRGGGEMKVSPEAENAYKTLIEGKVSTSNPVLLPREERDDPQRPSVEEEHDDASGTEDETNPLRMLRNEGANVVRRFTRQGSGRRQQLIEKPTPPVRRKCQAKCQSGDSGHKPSSNGKSAQDNSSQFKTPLQVNGAAKASTIERTPAKVESKPIRRPLPPPPPVPPRSSPQLDANRKIPPPTNHKPAIPPKPKLSNSPNERTRSNKAKEEDEERLVEGTSTTNENVKDDAVCPSFTLDDINKYDLLDFVLSGLPESKIAEERQRLISMEKGQRTLPSTSASSKPSTTRHPAPERAVTSRKEILIDEDAIHV